MKGFRDFLMQGNLIELATAVIIGAAFGDVVKAFTQIIMDVISLVIGQQPNFDQVTLLGVNVGVFLTAIVAFALIAAVLYFLVIRPYTQLMARAKKPEAVVEAPTTESLLVEIRDLLKAESSR